jgi:hypothetical protein
VTVALQALPMDLPRWIWPLAVDFAWRMTMAIASLVTVAMTTGTRNAFLS